MAFEQTEVAATALQAARLSKGWKQSRTILALQRQARADDVPIAGPSSLKTMLSRWENGERVGPVYRRLFCKVYDATELDLGIDVEDAPSRVTGRVAPAVDDGTFEYFQNVFAQHLRADNLMGPHHLVDVVRAQAALLDQVMPEARGKVRADLLVLACRYNEFTGWLYQDAGDGKQAMAYSDRAMDYALEINDPCETAYILMRKSNIASDLGRPDRALGLADAALRDRKTLSPQVRALVLGQRGRALTTLGEADECARTLNHAFREVEEPPAVPDERATYCNAPYVAMEAAACWSQLGKPDAAVRVFAENQTSWPTFQRRDRGLFLARFANAHAAREDKDSACRAGSEAVTVVRSATSARALSELQRLHSRLGPWHKDAEVTQLRRQIRDLVRPAA